MIMEFKLVDGVQFFLVLFVLVDILLGWCSGLCLIWKQIDPPGDLLVVCLGISLDWWCGIHCFWTHPMVCLVVST